MKIRLTSKQAKRIVKDNSLEQALRIIRHEFSNYDHLLNQGHDRKVVRKDLVQQTARLLMA